VDITGSTVYGLEENVVNQLYDRCFIGDIQQVFCMSLNTGLAGIDILINYSL